MEFGATFGKPALSLTKLARRKEKGSALSVERRAVGPTSIKMDKREPLGESVRFMLLAGVVTTCPHPT
jgi:hypothetical protein